MYISVASYIYSVWGPYFEPSARNLCCGGLCAQLSRQVAANPVQTTTTTNAAPGVRVMHISNQTE